MPLKGLILDIDGTLVLSNDAHTQAWVEAFAEFGYSIKFEYAPDKKLILTTSYDMQTNRIEYKS
jgi:beta-phosphoglucomutase-like phosphatase (HAD superfamily)